MTFSALFAGARSVSPARAKGFKRADLLTLFNEAGYKRGAEIGVAQGLFSELMCNTIPGLELLAVDTWEVGDDARSKGIGQGLADKRYAEAQERLAPFNAVLVKDTSVHASFEVPDRSLDFVYIDGCHEFDYVMEDLITWGRKVRKGGMISGHDYYRFSNSGVVQAVDLYTHMHRVIDWMVTDERTPSFFFEKHWD